ncbi:MAG TPA: response regulator [Candidatus Tectomicrobia bacterium]|nr:response regulator [Candidatus Tectomicrobia bacterium]
MPPAQILIVEDERIIAMELKRRITRLGYTVVAIASSGAEAVERARAFCPDLALMDIGLPGAMTGVEAGARIWEELKIPVIYATAYADEQTLAQVRTPQPVLIIRKPFEASQLRSTIEEALATPR